MREVFPVKGSPVKTCSLLCCQAIKVWPNMLKECLISFGHRLISIQHAINMHVLYFAEAIIHHCVNHSEGRKLEKLNRMGLSKIED